MKKDMARIIVERPRVGGTSPKGWNRRIDQEELPYKESMRERYSKGGERKILNEHLQPLRRFLNKAVGRKWDDVNSEICENIKLTSTVQRHILEHVAMEVEKNGFLKEDGKVYIHGYWARMEDICISHVTSHHYRSRNLYVHPVTGILSRPIEADTPPSKPKEVLSSKYNDFKNIQLHKINGIWCLVELRNTVPGEDHFDVVSRNFLSTGFHWRNVDKRSFFEIYGRTGVYGYRIIKQANKKDLKKHGLKNERV